MEHGYLLKKTDGSLFQTDMWQAGMAIVDFTNPDACKWYASYLYKLMDMGVDCFKTDFGERIPVRDIRWFDGSDPVYMHNYYTYLYNKVVFDVVKDRKARAKRFCSPAARRSAVSSSRCIGAAITPRPTSRWRKRCARVCP